MSDDLFLRSMRPVWRELSDLLEKGRKLGPKALSADELSRLDRLYRKTTVHLAQLRSRTKNEALIRDLNRLAANAHSFVYIAPERKPLSWVVAFYYGGFARVVARTRYFHLVSFLLFVSGALAGHFSFAEHPKASYAFSSPYETRLPGSNRQQLEEALRSGRDMGEGGKLVFSSNLFTRNTKVGFLAFTSGVLAGLPTVFIILNNGATLGTFVSIYQQKGIVSELWAWLLPHGITEILAVILCGGAGLMLAMAVIRPGFRTRRQSLLAAGKEALYVALGVIPMFLVAGLIEGFVRQSHWDTPTRLLFAAGTCVVWSLYFWNGYRQERLNQLVPPSPSSREGSAPSVRCTC